MYVSLYLIFYAFCSFCVLLQFGPAAFCYFFFFLFQIFNPFTQLQKVLKQKRNHHENCSKWISLFRIKKRKIEMYLRNSKVNDRNMKFYQLNIQKHEAINPKKVGGQFNLLTPLWFPKKYIFQRKRVKPDFLWLLILS